MTAGTLSQPFSNSASGGVNVGCGARGVLRGAKIASAAVFIESAGATWVCEVGNVVQLFRKRPTKHPLDEISIARIFHGGGKKVAKFRR